MRTNGAGALREAVQFYFKNSPGDKILMPSRRFSGKCFLFSVMIHSA